MSNTAQAIVFDAPLQLSIKTLEVKAFEANDIEVDVTFSGISTGTERLLWDGTMPPFPGLGYPLVPGYETVGVVSKVNPGSSVQIGDHVFVPGSYTFQGVRNIFGGAGSRLIVAHDRAVKVSPELGPKAVLLALAASGLNGQQFAFIPKGTGVLLVPVPELADLAGIAKGADPKDYRDRKDRV